MDLIPSRVKPMTLKLVFTASVLDAQHYGDNVKNKPASSFNVRDVPDTGYVSGIRHYMALFEVSGIRPDSTSLSGRIPDIFKVKENCVE